MSSPQPSPASETLSLGRGVLVYRRWYPCCTHAQCICNHWPLATARARARARGTAVAPTPSPTSSPMQWRLPPALGRPAPAPAPAPPPPQGMPFSIHIQALPHVQFYHRKVYIHLSSKLANGGLDLCVSPVRAGAALSLPPTTLACFVYIPGASMGQRQRPSRPFRRS